MWRYFTLNNCFFKFNYYSPNGEWTSLGGTATPSQSVVGDEQAQHTYPLS